MNSSEPYTSAVSISGQCVPLLLQQLEDVFPFRDPQSPGPMPGRQCRRETLPCAPVDAAPPAASRAPAPVGVANEPSATHSPLNSRRFSNLISLLFIRSLPPGQTFSIVKCVGLSNGFGASPRRAKSGACNGVQIAGFRGAVYVGRNIFLIGVRVDRRSRFFWHGLLKKKAPDDAGA
jgi:hypothetical protein